ncbi:hypothetical protein ANN_24347 [Periplaneta americana]|uniref:Uncharacterized protein n=1 Tax=Periplaneta americana TaxID=6978 RepID=A0ABQ8S335_PERAM|nr:hypothetical protein ANN_24347 [Periplaneta americana]
MLQEEWRRIPVDILSLTKRKLKNKRRWWQTPLYESRNQYRGTDLLHDLRRMESGQFHNFCRISETDFEICILLCKIGPKISKKDTGWREAIPIQERLALTLRYLATRNSYTSLMYLFKVSKQLITRIVPEVCTAIIEELGDFIKFRHPVGEIELSAAFCYELLTSGKSRPQRIPTSFDVPTSDGSLPKANQTIDDEDDLQKSLHELNKIVPPHLDLARAKNVNNSTLKPIIPNRSGVTLTSYFPNLRVLQAYTRVTKNIGVIVEGRRMKCIRFAADNVALLAEEMILRDMQLELNDSFEQYGMKINSNKTKTMVIGRKIKKVNMRIRNETVEQVGSFTYLRRNCLLEDEMEGMVNGRKVGGRRRYQMIDDIKIYGLYLETKRKAENRKDWKMLGLQ